MSWTLTSILTLVLIYLGIVTNTTPAYGAPAKGKANSKRNIPNSISSFYPGGQYIMLTFDEGPHELITPQLLSILKEKRVKATFFVFGAKLVLQGKLAKKIVDDGHEIATNGWRKEVITHESNIDKIIQYVNSSSKLIQNVTNTTVSFYRPFKGLSNADINHEINKKFDKMKIVMWSLECSTDTSSDCIQIPGKAKPGDIVRFKNTAATLATLPTIIDELYKDGYEFLTLSQVSSFPDDSPH